MTNEEKEAILDKVDKKCFLCKREVERKDMSLETAIKKLKNHPDYVGPEWIHYYMICPTCKKIKALI